MSATRYLSALFDLCCRLVGSSLGCPDADLHHATARRCRKEGRQGGLLHLDRVADRREDRQGLRGSLSRHRRAGRAQRLRAHVPTSRRGTRQQYPRRRRDRMLGHDGASLSGSGRAGWRPLCRRTWRRNGRPISAIPTAISRPSGLRCRRSRTTPSSSRPRMRQRALPTCSTRNGPARSSRLIPATAARS